MLRPPTSKEDEMSLWVKWDVNSHKDEKIARLTDMQFRAFITIIAEVKTLRSGGIFKNRTHVKAVIGPRLGRAVDKLVEIGLLTESGDGLVAVSNYSRWQVDPTSTSRQQKWRDQNRGGITVPEQSRAEQSRISPTPLRKRTGTSQPTPLADLLGGRRK
jgi:hypothetical protein